MNIFWLIFTFLLWGVVHSFLASLKVKEWVGRSLGDNGPRFYRLFYNFFSVISLLPVLWLMVVLPDEPLYQVPAPWSYFFLLGKGVAVLLLGVGLLQTDPLHFFGLRQLFDIEEKPSRLVKNGLYRWVRHPLYTAGLMFIWLIPNVSMNTFIMVIGSTVYFFVGAMFEERKLVREFGEAYEEYKATTPMLIPGLKFERNK